MQFVITKELLEENIKVLSEIPAKYSFSMIDALRRLPVMPAENSAKPEQVTVTNGVGINSEVKNS